MASQTQIDRRTERRDARRAQSRTDILDAAEAVFGEHGTRDGSMRKIADLSGFSSAAIYLFFENKQDLLAAVLTRRGDELIPALRAAAAGDASPMEKLHGIVDLAVAFFSERPHFQRVLRHLTGGLPIVGQKLPEFARGRDNGFADAMAVLAGIVSDGQRAGEIRAGDPGVIAYLYSVLVNEFVLLGTTSADPAAFSTEQFHGLVDGALRDAAPKRRRR